MTDLIDRQAALDKLNELKKVELVNAGNKPSKSYWALQAALMVVSGLPSAQQWVPCSEGLPEDGTEVLVYLYHNPKSPYIAWIEDSRWYTEEFEVDREYEPLAWQPLPEPWRGEE